MQVLVCRASSLLHGARTLVDSGRQIISMVEVVQLKHVSYRLFMIFCFIPKTQICFCLLLFIVLTCLPSFCSSVLFYTLFKHFALTWLRDCTVDVCELRQCTALHSDDLFMFVPA